MLPLANAVGQNKSIPIGLELFSVRKAMQEDLMGTVRKVASMGYEDVEFFSPYYHWTPDQAKDVRKLLDDVGMKCLSTHNALTIYKPENISEDHRLQQDPGHAVSSSSPAPASRKRSTTGRRSRTADRGQRQPSPGRAARRLSQSPGRIHPASKASAPSK